MKKIYITRETNEIKDASGTVLNLASNTRTALLDGKVTDTVKRKLGCAKGEEVVIENVDWIHAF